MLSNNQQLHSIQHMLSAGQRNLRVERHSLILWGLITGILMLASTYMLTPEQLPDNQQRAISWLLLLGLLIGGTVFLDWKLMREVKQARDETWSFIHRQVFKIWGLLLLIGILTTFSMFFYGGGYMVYIAWIILLGIGLYIHGLFSEELLEWIGALMIIIGIAMPAFHLNFQLTQWISAATAGIGLPLLAMLLDRGQHRAMKTRLLQTCGWLLAVLALPLLAHQLLNQHSIHIPAQLSPIPLAQYQPNNPHPQLVTLPAGTTIPVHIGIKGNIFKQENNTDLSLTLNTPIELLVNNQQLSGDWRYHGGDWHNVQQETNWLRIPWLKATLDGHSPQIHTQIDVKLHP